MEPILGHPLIREAVVSDASMIFAGGVQHETKRGKTREDYKLWEALKTLWGRSRKHRGKETKREQPRRDTESILIHQKNCPPKLPIARPWRPYW